MIKDKLKKQIEFIIEIDKMKNIFRRSYISDGSRAENDAEHSWHLAVMAIVMQEYFDNTVDVLKVIKMVLIHDLVEIYAGDTYLYDERGNNDKNIREQNAADKLFGMLPDEQNKEFISLWHEFEKRETQEAKFSSVLDRLQPILLNYTTKGAIWKQNNINFDQVLSKQGAILEGPSEIADFVIELLDDCVKQGYLKN